ncbi:TNF receptor-associated factor 4-like isoform X3 [Halichondria panicea]|uniref:TNF receptor-associated factor 4-like isoform X3 n=1 Tax=Halichondria panicea TaxID=6063 RepID=UPI00312B8C7A
MFGQFSRPSLSEGGYDYKFIEEPADSLKCLICLLVVREPQQHGGCGKLFCKVYIDNHKVFSNNCPHCRRSLLQMGQSTIFPDLKSEREVKSLLVHCPTACEWNGELRSLKDHIQKVCENAIVTCPNGCSNGKATMMRKNVNFHILTKCPNRPYLCTKCRNVMEFRNVKSHELNECPKRQYTCPHCNEAGVYDERTTTHLEVCPRVEIKCRKCSLQISRCDKSDHPLFCLNEPVRCTYYNIGCAEKPLRKDVTKHEMNAQLHLSLATKEVLRLNKIQLRKDALTFRMRKFEQNLEKKRFYSPPFHTSGAGYKMCILVYANGLGDGEGTHVTVAAHLMKGDNDDSLSWPFTGRVTVELLNQLEDKNHYKDTTTFPADGVYSQRVVDGERGEGWGWRKFISHADLAHKPLTNTQYLKDDTLIFRVSAEAHKPWLECTN